MPDLEPWETPYEDAEQAFFSMVKGQEALAAGARVRAGLGIYQRPGGGLDIQIVIERLYRLRKLTMDHIQVLRHYGVRKLKPDPYRPKEARSAMLWDEAMNVISAELKTKGLIA